MRLPHRPSHAVVIAYLALFVAATGTATAATGGSFLLGKSNSASHTTVLTNTGTGTALKIKTHSIHTAPLSISGNSTKVAHLNADLLDGLDSTKLQRKVVSACGAAGSISAIHSNGAVVCGPRSYFAVVSSAGTLVRGSAGAKAVRLTGAGVDAGEYDVTFAQSVGLCGYVADLGITSLIGFPTPGFASTAADLVNSSTVVHVDTFDDTGAHAYESFHVIVVCPPAS
jgi:hypothetical protein